MFSLTDKSGNGTSLQVYVEGVTNAQLTALFGASTDGYYYDEKGYDGNDRRFTEDSTGQVVNLYSRFGEFRVGATNRAVAERFKTWLEGVLASGAELLKHVK